MLEPAKVLSAHCGKNLYNRSQATATKSMLDHNMNQLAIAHRVAGNGTISHSLPDFIATLDFCWPEKWPKNAKSDQTLHSSAVRDRSRRAPALFQRAEKGAHKDTRPGFSTLFA